MTAQVDLRVRPVACGWLLESSGPVAPLVFRSGGAAERSAEDLAKALGAAGLDTRVLVLDRREQLVGAKRFWAWEPGAAASAGLAVPA
jgi:hypothetical protein